MSNHIRRSLFVIYAVFLRVPTWFVIWCAGRLGIFKLVFLIYPHSSKEYATLCPHYQPLIKFLSGRPTPGGLIFDGFKPIGIYLFIPDPPQELMKKKNRPLAETIVKRMRWVQRVSGAKAIGLAGQLGPIFERRHNIDMAPPFFTSTMGNIFSIEQTVTSLRRKKNKQPWQTSLAILGGGELGTLLGRHFKTAGYETNILDIQFKRRGGATLVTTESLEKTLNESDFVINLLPTGDDFLGCTILEHLPAACTIIDFSRPALPQAALHQKVVMGNRVSRPGMRFLFSLPGNWQRFELPACSIPSIMAAHFNVSVHNTVTFCRTARNLMFDTASAYPLTTQPAFKGNKVPSLVGQLMRKLQVQ